MKTWLGLVCGVWAIAACGSGDDGGPASEEHVTLASLPAVDRDAFEAWKGQVVKDCAWQQAFPSLAAEFPEPDGQAYVAAARVDRRALLGRTGGVPLVAGRGQLALLGDPGLDTLASRTQRTERHAAGGKVRVFDASAERSDGVCVIKLDGEEVFHAELPSALPVVASYDGAPPVAAGADLRPLIEGRADAGDPVAAIDGASLTAPVLAALAPRASVHGFLAAELGTTEAIARTVFPLGAPRAPDAVELTSAAGATPFAPRARIYGPRASLSAIYAGGTAQLALLFGGAGPELLALRADVAVDAGGKNPRVAAISVVARVPHDDAAARRCFTARAVASRFEAVQARSPAFDDQFAGCAALADDGFAALAGDAATRRAVATMALAAGVTPRAYRGWDRALIAVAQRMEEQGVALSELDPGGAIASLTTALARRAAIAGAISDPAARSALRGPVIALVLGWLFDAIEPSPALITAIGGALDHAAAAYPDSARTMLGDLGRGVAAQDPGARAAQCGAELTGERRAQIDHALAALDQVPFGDSVAADQRSHVLQLCPAPAALVELETAAAAATAFVTEDRARGQDSVTFRLDVEPLVVRALEERWTAATFGALADLIGFALVSDSTLCASRASRAEQAACIDLSLDRFSASGDGVLAPAVAARYASMARELTARWPGLAEPRLIGTRFDITDAWRGGLWRGCGDDGFARSRQQLYGLLDALRAATRFDDQVALAQQIAALVSATTCP